MIKTKNQSGFTLIELLLAMTVFSLALVIATVGFIGINRTFTRGVIRKNLSESAQLATEEATRTVRLSSSSQSRDNCSGYTAQSGCTNGLGTVCLSPVRYFWFTQDNMPGGLYKDNDASTCNSAPSVASLSQKATIVDERFRVRSFAIEALPTPGLHSVIGVFTTKDSNALRGLVSDGGTDPQLIVCRGTAENTAVQSCAVEKFKFIVSARGI